MEQKEILHSWKDIAAYLGKSSRTVQRWEREDGLPVRRIGQNRRSSVYALSRELDDWLSGQRELPEEPLPVESSEPQLSNDPEEPRDSHFGITVYVAIAALLSIAAVVVGAWISGKH